jgi:hypothetical protein
MSSFKGGKGAEVSLICEADDLDLEDEGLLHDDEGPPTLKRRVFLLCEDPTSSDGANWFANFMTSLITLSVLCFCLETTPELEPFIPRSSWFALEGFFVFCFSLEFIVRLACCPSKREFWVSTSAVLNYIDFIALMPFFLEVMARAAGSSIDDNLRLLKLFRILRVFKIARVGY